jgi:protoheme ferro-lyase
MRFNESTQDGMILLASDRRKGIWASQSNLKFAKTVRQAGQLPTSASAHTLQLVALSTALRSCTKSQASFLVEKAQCNVTKPRILVVTADPTFADALRAMMTRDAATLTTKPLKAGRNFLSMAAQQLARFELTLQTDSKQNDKSIIVLRSWADQHVFSPTMMANMSPSLCPVAASQVL